MDTEYARRQMIEQQIRAWDVFDPRVLNAFGGIPRDRFVPDNCVDAAYADTEIPLPHGQCMLRPSIVGRILQALDLRRNDEVLEIGTGTGYLTACLAQVAGSVTSIDIFPDFIEQAGTNLGEVDTVTLHCMDAMTRLPEGLFDAIAVTGSVRDSAGRFGELLKPGGRLFIVRGKSPVMTALLMTRGEDGAFTSKALFETDIPALITPPQPQSFSF